VGGGGGGGGGETDKAYGVWCCLATVHVRVDQLLHETGDTRHETAVRGSGACARSVGALAIGDRSDPLRRHLDVLVYNHVDDAHTSTDCEVCVISR
jgi:hypothetical protein